MNLYGLATSTSHGFGGDYVAHLPFPAWPKGSGVWGQGFGVWGLGWGLVFGAWGLGGLGSGACGLGSGTCGLSRFLRGQGGLLGSWLWCLWALPFPAWPAEGPGGPKIGQ